MEQQLFAEFPATDSSQWIKMLNKELKGKDYRDELIWHTIEGIDLEPFYASRNQSDSYPGRSPYTRTRHLSSQQWEIDQLVLIGKDFKKANANALEALQGGATSITFSGDIQSAEELDMLMKNIGLQYIEIRFENLQHPVSFLKIWQQYFEKQTGNCKNMRGSVSADPIADALASGKWKNNPKEDIKAATSLAASRKKEAGLFRTNVVDAAIYHNAGANTVEEIAFALAHGHEYLHSLVESGMDIDEAASHMAFCFADGPDFYFTIAKYRAFRKLWSTIISAYSPKHTCSHNAFLTGTNSQLYLSHLDQYSNLLRFTSETFASVTGGCDAFRVARFNAATKTEDAFADRIGRNIQLILREESHLDKVVDPAGGSYFIEHLTRQLTDRSWALFREIEKEGGCIAYIESGKLQATVAASAERLKELFLQKKVKMIGVNSFPNKNETAEKPLQKTEYSGGKTAFPPLQCFRLSELQEVKSL